MYGYEFDTLLAPAMLPPEKSLETVPPWLQGIHLGILAFYSRDDYLHDTMQRVVAKERVAL